MISKMTRAKISTLGRTPILDRESLAEILTVLHQAGQITEADFPEDFVIYRSKVMDLEDYLALAEREGYDRISNCLYYDREWYCVLEIEE